MAKKQDVNKAPDMKQMQKDFQKSTSMPMVQQPPPVPGNTNFAINNKKKK